ncbi:MAG: YfhO family protein [Bacteroidota bacterium]
MNFKKYLPHILAVITFAIITFISFKPLFNGKSINQSDITQHRGMSRELVDFREKEQAEALWTNSMFGGMPAYQVSTLYPGNWINQVDRFFHLYFPHPSGHIFMCFLGFFILLLCLEINPWLAFVGALGYGFSSYFFIILEVGHNSKANAISYLAPVLGGIILLMRGKYRLGFAVATLFMALELNANHVQITYYGFMIFVLVFISYFIKAIKEKNSKSFFMGAGLFAIACILAFLPNAGSLLATEEYGHYSTRGKSELTIDASLQSNKANATSGLDKSYALMYSHGIWETWTFLIPHFKGGASAAIGNVDKDALKKVDPQFKEQVAGGNAYFGDQGGTAGPVYIGAIIIFLAFLGLLIVEHPLKWPLFAVTLLAMMLSWGRFFPGLSYFFLDYVPGYNKFRAVSMILIIAELTLPLMAVLALDKFMKLSDKNDTVKLPFITGNYDLKKILIISIAVVGGFCLIGYVMPTVINTFLAPNEQQSTISQFKQSGATDEQIAQVIPGYMENLEKARMEIFKSDALRSFIFIALGALGLFLFMLKKIKAPVLFALIGVCFTADLWPVATRYLNDRNFVQKSQFEAPPQKTAADEQILQDPALDYRVLNLSVGPFQDATTSYYHKSIGGYHGAKLKKYDELISFHLSKEMGFFSDNLRTVSNDSTLNVLTQQLPVLNMLNTKYIIWPGKEQPMAITNPQANGNAWFVKTIKTVANADSEMVALYGSNTKTEAIIQQKNKEGFATADTYKADGTINLKSYKPNNLVYETETSGKEFAVFSEIYYPKGWNAYIDGTLTPYACVDYLLRGMEIPAGKHTVEFKFEPAIYKTGNTISIIGSILVLLAVGGAIYFAHKKKEFSI